MVFPVIFKFHSYKIITRVIVDTDFLPKIGSSNFDLYTSIYYEY